MYISLLRKPSFFIGIEHKSDQIHTRPFEPTSTSCSKEPHSNIITFVYQQTKYSTKYFPVTIQVFLVWG